MMGMPQLVKGGKWVFGWCIVGPAGEIQIPPEAYVEYDFQPGEKVFIIRGSQRSGGVSIGRPEKIENSPVKLCFIGEATIDVLGRITLPTEANIQPGERLLAVRGSSLALGFLQRGSIFEEALKHQGIEIFHKINNDYPTLCG
jgi:hypothetical protein